MINIDIESRSIEELVLAGEVDIIVQGCNCFHLQISEFAESLKRAAGDAAIAADHESEHGDINKLGKFTCCTLDGERPVDIYNLYCRYALPAPNCTSIHWNSLYTGLEKIVDGAESGYVVAIQYIADSPTDREAFLPLLETFAKENDNELPDIDIIIITE